MKGKTNNCTSVQARQTRRNIKTMFEQCQKTNLCKTIVPMPPTSWFVSCLMSKQLVGELTNVAAGGSRGKKLSMKIIIGTKKHNSVAAKWQKFPRRVFFSYYFLLLIMVSLECWQIVNQWGSGELFHLIIINFTA